MSKKGEYGEPVYAQIGDEGYELASDCGHQYSYPALIERAAACVNALDGLEPERLRDFIRAAEDVLDSGSGDREDFLDRLGRRLRTLSDALDALGVPRG